MIKPVPSQVPLDFEPVKARAVDPKTSQDAARAINKNPSKIRLQILAQLTIRNMATFEIATALGKERDSISPHMKPLERMGYIRRTGQTKQRPGGRQCEVWQKI
jgi:predicted transcriptional regulator